MKTAKMDRWSVASVIYFQTHQLRPFLPTSLEMSEQLCFRSKSKVKHSRAAHQTPPEMFMVAKDPKAFCRSCYALTCVGSRLANSG